MRAADLLVTKAGPGAISEAFVSGLPLIIFDYIPGQESGNITYVQTHDAGLYAPTAQAVAALVKQWLGPDNGRLAELAGNAARLARPQAALDIAAEICRLIQTDDLVHYLKSEESA
jgi:1,2-diacylglycerol 3-beta-galactosyltransferase